MKSFLVLIMTFFATFNLYAQVLGVPVGDTTGGGYRVHIDSGETYFKHMDLDSIYLSPTYGGSPGYFVYGEFDRDNDGELETPVVGVYFKGETGLGYADDYVNEAPARDVSSGYSCTEDENKNVAKMDAAAINGFAFENEYDDNSVRNNAILALNDYLKGYRIVDLVTSDYFGRCVSGQIKSHDDWHFPTILVFEWLKKSDYEAGEKADIIHVDITPGGYGIFSFYRTSNGKIENSEMLKQLYKEAGYL